MIEVRHAELADLPACLDLTAAFHAASPMADVVPFDHEGMLATLANMITNPRAGLWLALRDAAPVGVAGALLYPLYFNPAREVVQELFWWLEPAARGSGAGKIMFRAIQDWAERNHAAAVFMVALDDDRVGKMDRFYKRDGFVPMERTYMKGSVSWQ